MGAFDFADFFSRDLDDLKQEGRYRVFADLERLSKGAPYAWDHRRGRTITIWCSNDYLSMGVHPDVVEAAQAAIRTYGAGAGGTRNISGTSHEHVLLERDLADLHGKEAALLFTSGYAANDAALSTLASRLPGAVIFSDALNHASMIEGMRRSGVEKHIFAHNDWRDQDGLAGPAQPQPHPAGDDRGRGDGEEGDGPADGGFRRLYPADQLPDRCARDRAPQGHAHASSCRRGRRATAGGADRNLAR